ncbi:hypothetical protein DB32_005609 [Sandaracinus amylolyticus]|uniref:Outer membrane protein beta-barrel domain-containing protein n=2 Tax=Sandaracinus amylolyticus TaxID=927083 RepID=A0A0F6YK44_9BACT|nr:hypothetical protein DB32_005609 [Sandaracinus amylolyticus]
MMRALIIVALIVASIPARTHAQDVETAIEADAEAVRADVEAPAPDELPEGADFGPAILVSPRELTPAEQRRERARRYDATEPLMPTTFQIFVSGGVPLRASLDDALEAHRYGSSPVLFAGDFTLMTRIAEWLWLGGRVGARGRGWGSNNSAPAVGGGIDALAVAHVRAHLGPIVDLGAVLGVGLGWGGVSIQGAGTWAFAPRLSGYAQVGFRVAQGVRIGARVGWDWFSMYDLDRYGSDLELGGPLLGIGLEVRR